VAEKSRWLCEIEGCEKGIATGHALYRTSPTGEGQKFRGRCAEHATPEQRGPEDEDVAGLIERENLKAGRAR
jgi:hypothetical protein